MKSITSIELSALLKSNADIQLIDVREEAEHAEFNIGGELIPLGRIQSMDLDQLDAFKEKELILYCRSGNRSGQACQILEMMGFTNTKNLQGGMLAWQQLQSK